MADLIRALAVFVVNHAARLGEAAVMAFPLSTDDDQGDR